MGNSRIQITFFSPWKINCNSTLNYFREVIWLELHSSPSFLAPYGMNLFHLLVRRSAIFLAVCVCIEAIWQNHGFYITDSGLICASYSTCEHWSPLRCCTSRTLEKVWKKKNKQWLKLAEPQYCFHISRNNQCISGCAFCPGDLVLG